MADVDGDSVSAAAVLREAEVAAAAEPAAVPELAPVAEDGGGNGEISRTQSKREKRRQRRRARPHGRR